MIRKLKQSLLLLAFTLLLTACGGRRVENVQTPSDMSVQRGRNYKEVIEDFQDKGFTNIRTEPIRDLEIGWTVKLEEVEEISVGGDTNYDAGAWVPSDTEVIIRYHATMLYHETEDDAGAAAAANTADTADNTDTVDTTDTADTTNSADTTDTADTTNSSDTTKSSDTANSSGTADTANSSDTTEPADRQIITDIGE